MNLLKTVRNCFTEPIRLILPSSDPLPYLEMLKTAVNLEHGDYQANFAMSMAKLLGRKPPDLANEIVSLTENTGVIEKLSVAGPGFINIRLSTAYLQAAVRELTAHPALGINPSPVPKTVVIDYSGPNVAKPLHVGHLRSTIIGDAIARILRLLGHKVITDNHLGDWGAQFGILLYGYKNLRDEAAFAADPVRELARLYVHVRTLFKQAAEDDEDDQPVEDPVKAACQAETAKLHAGDPENLELWRLFLPHCMAEIHGIYRRLGILPFDFEHGESYYNPLLAGVVESMLQSGLASVSQGAVVIPNAAGKIPTTPEEMKKQDPPGLIRKRDGAFTYTTTDLATIQYRVDHFHPDLILYVVDFRQSLHFKTVIAQAQRWGYDRVDMKHLSFGSVLGEDKKPFAARKGGAPELATLIEEAVARGLAKYRASYDERKASGHKVPELTPEVQADIAEAVGIGAIKYADLSQNRTSDYVFSYEKMLATEGNTASYMQYAYARCRSIFRTEQIDESRFRTSPPEVLLVEPAERTLAVLILRFPETVEAAAADFFPHVITGYLWDLAKAYSGFYENCAVLNAPTPELRESRLLLVDLVARLIRQCLDLLGIRTVEQM